MSMPCSRSAILTIADNHKGVTPRHVALNLSRTMHQPRDTLRAGCSSRLERAKSRLTSGAYREIKEDQHPIVVVSAIDIVDILRSHGHGDAAAVRRWLVAEFRNNAPTEIKRNRQNRAVRQSCSVT